MTASSPPPPSIEWEPQVEGIVLGLRNPHAAKTVNFRMPMMSVRELRDDMEEAAMLARGFEKVEDFAALIAPRDLLVLMSDSYEVTNRLVGLQGREEVTVIQFKLNTYSPIQAELTFPPDQLVTYWRRIE